MRVGTALVLAVVLLAAPAAADRVHVVQPGESLWKIAAVLTGDPTLWPLLYRANRDQIVDPSRLYPGQKLSIPDLEPDAPAPVGAEPGPSGPR